MKTTGVIQFQRLPLTLWDKLILDEKVILYQCRSIWPFDFFPDRLVVKTDSIEIINKIFFGSESVSTIRLEDIAEVELEYSPFAATIHITRNIMRSPPEIYTITQLHTDQAKQAVAIIKTLIEAKKLGINLETYSPEYLREEVKKLIAPPGWNSFAPADF